MGIGFALSLMAWAGAAGPMGAHGVPMCDDPQTERLRVAGPDEVKAHGGHDPGPISYAFGTGPAFYDFHAAYVIGPDGHVSCLILHGWGMGAKGFSGNAQRQAFADTLAAQTFTPFETDGEPSSVRVETTVLEQERPLRHVDPPAGGSADIDIRLESSGRRSEDGPYVMTIKNDGTVTFTPSGYDYAGALGQQVYQITPDKMAAIRDRINTADFWSLRDHYGPILDPEIQARFKGLDVSDVYRRVTVTLGGQSKTFTQFDGGGDTGAPESAARLMEDLATLAGIDLWHEISPDTVAILEKNGFDFKSDAGLQLLIQMTANPSVPDSAIDDLIARGAPTSTVLRDHFVEDTSLLDAALWGDREALATRLIDAGGLLTDGKADEALATRALAHAVPGGSPALVAKILALHPKLWTQIDGKPCPATGNIDCDSIITSVSDHIQPDASARLAARIAITEQLLAAGAHLDDHGGDWRGTLLEQAIQNDDPAFVGWLLNKGARIGPGDLSLAIERNSDGAAVALLVAGAKIDPKTDDKLFDEIQDSDLSQTRRWLKAHGQWPFQ